AESWRSVIQVNEHGRKPLVTKPQQITIDISGRIHRRDEQPVGIEIQRLVHDELIGCGADEEEMISHTVWAGLDHHHVLAVRGRRSVRTPIPREFEVASRYWDRFDLEFVEVNHGDGRMTGIGGHCSY